MLRRIPTLVAGLAPTLVPGLVPALIVGAMLTSASGCAGFRRGEYWDESTETSASPGDDEGDESPQTTGGEGPQTTGDTEPTTGDDTTGDGPQAPSFGADVLPLLDAGCERCHAADGAASHTDWLLDVDEDTAYLDTLEFVDLENPEKSPVLTKGAGLGHTGGVIYDEHSSEHATILAWIEGGALP